MSQIWEIEEMINEEWNSIGWPYFKHTTASPYQATVYSPRPHPYCITLILLPIQTIIPGERQGARVNSQGKKKQEGEDKQEEEEKQPNWLGYSTWDTLPEIKATFATISEPLITVGENKKNKVKTVISWLGETEDTSLQENSHQDRNLLL